MSNHRYPFLLQPPSDVFPMDAVTETIKERSVLFHYRAEYPIELGILRAILSIPWPGAEVHSMKSNSNTFMAIFPTFVEKSKAICDQPWIVNGVILSLESWPSGDKFFTVPVNSSVTWVQIHGLKDEHSNRATAWTISSLFPAFYGSVFVPPHGVNNFGHVRLRVAIDNSKPLIPVCTFSYNHSEPYLLSFKYEKLSCICYDCGFLGHAKCGKVPGGENALCFGEWMHGDTPLSGYANAEPCVHSSTWADMMERHSQILHFISTNTRKDGTSEISPAQELDFINIGRWELQNRVKRHIYYDPILGWTMDQGFPRFEDNFLQLVFGYTFTSHESFLIQTWEDSENNWTWCNSRLNQFRKYFERISKSLNHVGTSSRQHSKNHPTYFPNISVIDQASEVEPSSSSSSCSGSSLNAGIVI